MKKSVFTLLAIATAVFTMSSCSKDDAGSNAVNTSVAQQTQTQTSQSQAPVVKNYYAAKVALDSTLLDMGTYTLTVQDGDKTQEYVINTAGKAAQITAGRIAGLKSVIGVKGIVHNGVEFRLGFTSTSKTVKFALSFKAKEGYVVPEDQEIGLVYNIAFANVASESDLDWNCAGLVSPTKNTECLAEAQKIVASASQTFTK